MPPRTFIHVDLNNFYASAEILSMPQYRDVPLAVCGDPALRHGIVLAKNMPAKAYGVQTGETVWQAKQKCPGLVCVPPHFDLYMRFSEQAFTLYTTYTDLVEPFGPDECWLDVTGSARLFGDGKAIADDIRARIKRETGGLTVSAGVAFSKIFAKMGSDLKKPDATSVMTQENFKDVLWPLPAADLCGIGRQTAKKLALMNINTVGDLARADEAVLKSWLGVPGVQLRREAAGEEIGTVRPYYQSPVPKSVGHGVTTTRDLIEPDDFRVVVYYLSDLIARRLRAHGLVAAQAAVTVRDNDLRVTGRQGFFDLPTSSGTEIGARAFDLVTELRPRDALPARSLTVTTFALDADAESRQSLFDTAAHERNRRMDKGLDKIQTRFGRNAVVRGNLVASVFIHDRVDAEVFLPFRR
ncbi:MAG: DNA polymerase IV [Clostridiales bacterium]|jgi:DNA polymerase-4|nr:DNA polymerase IV [Clostridiales bacterium]